MRLRKLAEDCRRRAASLHRRRTAETLLEMARQFDASAEAVERLPLARAYAGRPRRSQR